MYKILSIDLSECCYANVHSDGEIEILFEEKSIVPNKHSKGGQSKARFERCRENEITQWFKSVDSKLMHIEGEFIVGISQMYYKRFVKHLHTYNKQKIKKHYTNEYSGLTGVYNLLNTLNNEK